MSINKFGKRLLSLAVLLVFGLSLASCQELKEDPKYMAKKTAEQNVQRVLERIIFSDEDSLNITSSVNLITKNSAYPDVEITYTSSEEDVIQPTGRVVRPAFDDKRAELHNEHLVVPVILTAHVKSSYSYVSNGETVTKYTDEVTKEFKFTVAVIPEGTTGGTIADVKAKAWNYIYVENKVQKGLVTNDSVLFSVMVTGRVIGKLNADGATKGFFINDGTDSFYVYGDNTKLKVGDVVEVIGDAYTYYGNIQIGKNISVSKLPDDPSIVVPEHREITPEEWEQETKDLTDDVIGYIGGKLLKVSGFLQAITPAVNKYNYKIVDAKTGEEAWVYYKSYDKEQEAVLKAHLGEYVCLTGISFDRDSRSIQNDLLWTGEIEKREVPELTDEEKVKVTLAGVGLLDKYTEDFELPAVGKWEVVKGTGIAIDGNVAKVTQTNEKSQTVILKLTVTFGQASDTKEFTIKIPRLIDPSEPTYTVESNFEVGKEYLFGMVQKTLDATLYLVGTGDVYLDATEDPRAAAKVVIEEVEKGQYRIKVLAGGKTLYVESKIVKGKTRATLVETPTQTWAYNAEWNTFTVEVNGVVNYLGTFSNYDTFGLSKIDHAATSFVGHLYKEVESKPIVPGKEWGVVEKFEVGKAYKLGLDQKNKGKVLYLTGAEKDGKPWYLLSTDNKDLAADVIVEQGKKGYNLKVVANGVTKYLVCELSDTHYSSFLRDVPGIEWTYDEKLHTFVALVGEVNCAIGTHDTFDTFSCTQEKFFATSFLAQLYGEVEATPAPDPEPQPTNWPYEVGQAYKLSLFQGNKNATYYFTGEMAGYYLATSTDIATAVDVFCEKVEGGYKLYFMDADVKTYIGVEEAMGTDNKMHINVKLGADVNTVFNWNATLLTMSTISGEKELCLGTRNDRDFATIGGMDCSRNPFVCKLEKADGTNPQPDPDPQPEPDKPVLGAWPYEVGKPYRLTLVHTNPKVNKSFYFTGKMQGFYFATSEYGIEGVEVFCEKVEGGYKLYFMEKDVKNYIGIVLSNGHINAVFGKDVNCVFNWEDSLKTMVTLIDSKVYFLGTKAAMTYSTIGASDDTTPGAQCVATLSTPDLSPVPSKPEPVAPEGTPVSYTWAVNSGELAADGSKLELDCGEFTITLLKGDVSNTKVVNKYNELRVYQDHQFIITAKNGKKINAVVFEDVKKSGATLNFSLDTNATLLSSSVSSNAYTVAASKALESITFSPSAQIRIKTITVYFAK